jgi:steroid 5-alpha reductase family enzyme
MSAILAASAGLVLVAMTSLWLLSLRLRDASIADVFWGSGFAAVGVLSAAMAPASPRGLLVGALATAWGLRLSVHLGRRWWHHGQEDRRYRNMRAHWGDRFPLVSLFTVFLFQGALMWVVSLPLQAAAARGGTAPLGALDAAGMLVFGVGLAFEAVGDAQLARFLADPAQRGQVMQSGLWRLTRHPNYFGDALVWWGIGLVAVAAGATWSLVGPALMTFFLVRVSGVSLLEKDIGERRPGYADYVRRTSAFLPLPPRAVRPAASPPPTASRTR